MKTRYKNSLLFGLVALLTVVVLGACSTTRRIPADEILYTGVKKMKIYRTDDDSVKLARNIRGQLRSAVEVPPNNYISLIRWRYPFPLGLWVYNYWNEPKKGLGHWLYNKLVEEPVLVSDVRPEVRTHMIEQILDNNGYFRNTASYQLVESKNKRKARIRYIVHPGLQFHIDTVIPVADTSPLGRIIDSLARHDSYLSRRNPAYCTDSLSTARTRITNYLRNHGYYYFRPDFIEYLADSVAHPTQISLKMMLASNMPAISRRCFTTGKVTMHIDRYQGGGRPDTIPIQRGTMIVMQPARLRKTSINSCVSFREGRTFSVRNMDRTQTNLSRLGIFNNISIEALPDTTAAQDDVLNVNIYCTFDAPLETSLEVNASSKSNSYIGPGLTFDVTNKNIFGGGEQLSVKLNGSYEWQTGNRSNSIFNSYEAGITAALGFPRLLAPRFIPRSRFQLNWTRFQINADLLNRPHFFKMAQFNTSVTYDWRVRRHVQNSFTLVKFSYTNLMHTTADFDSIMVANPAVAMSFRSQYIPQMMYTYTYDRDYGGDHTLNWTFTLQEAGNIFWGIYRAFGVKGEKELFGTPFSQFVKGSTQLVYGKHFSRWQNWVVGRVAVGAAHAYGNSTQVPFAEQFYVGGANSIRAFTVRALGPGSYTPPKGQPEENFDRTGTFKLEANIEYRFPIYKFVHGATFVDAGNVWLLKDDPARPGGTVHSKTFLRDIALGTGVGLRFDFDMLVVRADLGVGIHAPYNTGKSGYYNMTSFRNSLALHLAIGYPF